MPRSNDTYTLPPGTWVYPTGGDTLDVAGWKTLIDDIAAAISDSLSRSQGTMAAQFKAISGSAVAPGVSFTSASGSGMYSHSGNLRFAVGGADVVGMGADLLEVNISGVWRQPVYRDLATTITTTLTGGSGAALDGVWAGDPEFTGNPNFTGHPTATTQVATSNSTRIATTAHVKAYVTGENISPTGTWTFTNNLLAAKPPNADNSTRVATTSFVQSVVNTAISGVGMAGFATADSANVGNTGALTVLTSYVNGAEAYASGDLSVFTTPTLVIAAAEAGAYMVSLQGVIAGASGAVTLGIRNTLSGTIVWQETFSANATVRRSWMQRAPGVGLSIQIYGNASNAGVVFNNIELGLARLG